VIFWDTFIRFSGVGLLLCLAVLSLRDVKKSQSARFLVLSCISTAALLIGFTPAFLPPPKTVLLAARFIDIPHLIFIWLFALSLFDSAFKVRWFHALIALAYCLPIFLIRLVQFRFIERKVHY